MRSMQLIVRVGGKIGVFCNAFLQDYILQKLNCLSRLFSCIDCNIKKGVIEFV